eukprot:scaffold181101_cov39-Prasinocladus_malaysianus.AAC.2
MPYPMSYIPSSYGHHLGHDGFGGMPGGSGGDWPPPGTGTVFSSTMDAPGGSGGDMMFDCMDIMASDNLPEPEAIEGSEIFS